MNEISYPVQNLFLTEWLGDSAPNSNFSKLMELSETSQARKLIFGLQVNIDKTNSRTTLPGRQYRGRSAPAINLRTPSPCLFLK